MFKWALIYFSIPVCAYLYRLGGGDIWPFKSGHKPFRRYALPIVVYLVSHQLLQSLVFCLILHFNLDEIEERDWDDVFTYGLAQAWCFYGVAGPWSLLLGLSWSIGVWLSNIGIPIRIPQYPENINPNAGIFKVDWRYIELAHGAVIGGLLLL